MIFGALLGALNFTKILAAGRLDTRPSLAIDTRPEERGGGILAVSVFSKQRTNNVFRARSDRSKTFKSIGMKPKTSVSCQPTAHF